MMTVLDNAYFKKAQEHPNFGQVHQKLLFWLLYDKKYYSNHELLCLTNYNEKQLDQTISDLTQTGTIKTEGWLVKIVESENLQQTIVPEIKQLIVTSYKKQSMK